MTTIFMDVIRLTEHMDLMATIPDVAELFARSLAYNSTKGPV